MRESKETKKTREKEWNKKEMNGKKGGYNEREKMQ